ncbi:hypothetical protein [Actinopolymorpha alba]|uniref:hypothetical protein n=1 Tax=Actinopolymorpha alba TaxID=533267 RepID=UPI000364C354|nr:hypothetical protein [Actinopolymorpha alba]
MSKQLPESLRPQIQRQAGAVALDQAYAAGLSKDQVRARVDAGRWRLVLPRVYVTYDGQLRRSTELWAALLYAGEGAAVSHATAAEVWGLLDSPVDVGTPVHITVPVTRRVRSHPGLRIRRSRRLGQAVHPARQPSRTRVEETVLDLADEADQLESVVGWITRACQRRRTTPPRLSASLAARTRFRWRGPVEAMLVDVSQGAETPLELAYLRLVERAHGLPEGNRQRHRYASTGSKWIDVRYEAFGLIVELDGRLGHVDAGAFRDRRRDNYSTETGYWTLRYGWSDTFADSCAVAAQVARVLRQRGWRGQVKACPSCGSSSRQTAA